MDNRENKPYPKSLSLRYYALRVADRAFPEIKVSWRQPGDFGGSLIQTDPRTKAS